MVPTMKILTCPLNGPRPVSEFFYWAKSADARPAACDDATWADYVFNRNGAPA